MISSALSRQGLARISFKRKMRFRLSSSFITFVDSRLSWNVLVNLYFSSIEKCRDFPSVMHLC